MDSGVTASASDFPPLEPLDHTCVFYDRSSSFSLLMAWASMVPLIIFFGLVALCIFQRHLQDFYFAFGLLFSSAVNGVLKRIIKEPRPEGCIRGGYGMPSDHSQYMGFFFAYFTLWVFHRAHFQSNRFTRVCSSTLVGVLFVSVGYSRIHLYYHTVEQVLAGGSFGICLGAMHYLVGTKIVYPKIFPAIARSSLGEYFYLIDGSHVENVLRTQYLHFRAKQDEGKHAKSS